ncbi:decarboxylating 6-phosphogluconate dehydrogenase [Actinobacteria bacterium YIM 96077]|uniref:Decarboxylating 6-phosphogluconate dehydrogenase n=1 Tax=Phytoactinopolyspora halophila TaxID=1981511 RepID=A0A329QQR4_9ACTN|nr:decarboxylating 6-phosphogluconate dehydrogenase [Actinobacteria bacterium YIM 96077]RAW14707.1 decarboxylating 6-phosphogluconate dehydrogenase [Phytoactinopolyspora halophila]
MQVGLVGLGRMGHNMRERLREAGHKVVGYALDPEVSDVRTLTDLVDSLSTPRAVWLMVPSGEPTHSLVAELTKLLSVGDIVIDGGNSRFTEDLEHARMLGAKGIGYVDCGVSGGIWGREHGYGLMVGGDAEYVERLMPIFDALRPDGPREEGFVHAGDVGAGHYAKMVHNGVEYGLMQAYAEGFELLEASDRVTNVPGVFNAWRRGTVVRSWLLDLLVEALDEDPSLSELVGYVEDSGEGRWVVAEALESEVPTPTMAAALFARFASRQSDSPAMRAVAALRQQFGGHSVRSAGPNESTAGSG